MRPNSTPKNDMDIRQFQAVEAESSLIVSALIDGNNAAEIAEIVQATDFFSWKAQTIFQAIESLIARQEPVGFVSVTDLLRKQGRFEKIGGATAIASMPDTIPGAVSIPHCCKLVKQAAQRREIYSRCNEIRHAVLNEPDHENLLDTTQKAFIGIDETSQTDSSDSFESLVYSRPEIWENLKNKGGMTGVLTGLGLLDQVTGGFQSGDLIVLAARPAIGKTAFALGRAGAAACSGHPVHILSLEMGSGQLFDRMAASEARIDLQKFRMGNFTQAEWIKLNAAMEKLHGWPIIIERAHGWSISQIARCIRRRWREKGTKLVIIDYLQLIRGNPNIQRKDLEVGEITRALKTLAVELSIPVILLSQLNRKVEERPIKRPKLSDLRESGAIEQDADLVIFIYRDEVYFEESPEKGVAEISVAKHRNGPSKMVKVAWAGWRCTFEDL